MTTPSVLLRPMTEDEYADYSRTRDRDYVASLSASRSQAAAEAKARQDREGFLPSGVKTPGHHLLCAELASGEVVGAAWLGLTEPRTGATDTAWLYDLWIDPAHRRRGCARAVLDAVERRAHAAGAVRLGLNVFGENAAALALYEATGYRVTTQQMAKDLG